MLRLSVHQGLTDDELGAIRELDSGSENTVGIVGFIAPGAAGRSETAVRRDGVAARRHPFLDRHAAGFPAARPFGLFLLASCAWKQQYDAQDVDLLASIGYQIGVAIENAQLIARDAGSCHHRRAPTSGARAARTP